MSGKLIDDCRKKKDVVLPVLIEDKQNKIVLQDNKPGVGNYFLIIVCKGPHDNTWHRAEVPAEFRWPGKKNLRNSYKAFTWLVCNKLHRLDFAQVCNKLNWRKNAKIFLGL